MESLNIINFIIWLLFVEQVNESHSQHFTHK